MSNWSNFSRLSRRAGLSAIAGLSCFQSPSVADCYTWFCFNSVAVCYVCCLFLPARCPVVNVAMCLLTVMIRYHVKTAKSIVEIPSPLDSPFILFFHRTVTNHHCEVPMTSVLTLWLDAHCCHIGTAIKHPVPDRVKPSFVIFDVWLLWRPALSVRVPGCQKLQMTA